MTQCFPPGPCYCRGRKRVGLYVPTHLLGGKDSAILTDMARQLHESPHGVPHGPASTYWRILSYATSRVVPTAKQHVWILLLVAAIAESEGQ